VIANIDLGFDSMAASTFKREPALKRQTISSAMDLGVVARSRREELGLSIVQVAELAKASRFFVSDLERGKPSVQFDKVLSVLSALRLQVVLARKPAKPQAELAPRHERLVVRPRLSIDLKSTHQNPEAIVCLECGLSVRSMERHLSSVHSMRTSEYRRRWNLPAEYDLRPVSVAEKIRQRKLFADVRKKTKVVKEFSA
jgi:predicted transcriptional regulator